MKCQCTFPSRANEGYNHPTLFVLHEIILYVGLQNMKWWYTFLNGNELKEMVLYIQLYFGGVNHYIMFNNITRNNISVYGMYFPKMVMN